MWRSDPSIIGVQPLSCLWERERERGTVCVCRQTCDLGKSEMRFPRPEVSWNPEGIATLVLSVLLRLRHFGGLQVWLPSSLNLVLGGVVWSTAHLNSVEITCCFHYTVQEAADAPQSMGTNVFGISWKSVLRKWFDLRQKVCIWFIRCVIFFYQWHILGQLYAITLFFVTVLIEGSEINDSVVTEKGK
jgi:hypothetical protein